MRLILLILVLLSATIGAVMRLFGLTGLGQIINDARGAPAQTRYTKMRYKVRSR